MSIDTYSLIYISQFPILIGIFYILKFCGAENFLLNGSQDKFSKSKRKNSDNGLFRFQIMFMAAAAFGIVFLSASDLINFIAAGSEMSFSSVFSRLILPTLLKSAFCAAFLVIATFSINKAQQLGILPRILFTAVILMGAALCYTYVAKGINQNTNVSKFEITDMRQAGDLAETVKEIDQFFQSDFDEKPSLYVRETPILIAQVGNSGVFVSRGYLQTLTTEELLAGISHEAEHYYKQHTWTGVAIVVLFLLFLLAFNIGCFLWRKYFTKNKISGGKLSVAGLLMAFFAFVPLMQMIVMANNRQIEREADSAAVKRLLDKGISPERLKTAIYKFDGDIPSPSLLTYYLFFTHPSYEERAINIDKATVEYQSLKQNKKATSPTPLP